MPIDKTKISQEMLTAAMQCKDADELMALAKAEGLELDEKQLTKVAGGGCYPDCPNDYCFEN